MALEDDGEISMKWNSGPLVWALIALHLPSAKGTAASREHEMRLTCTLHYYLATRETTVHLFLSY